jgi:hypothetical protein
MICGSSSHHRRDACGLHGVGSSMIHVKPSHDADPGSSLPEGLELDRTWQIIDFHASTEVTGRQ